MHCYLWWMCVPYYTLKKQAVNLTNYTKTTFIAIHTVIFISHYLPHCVLNTVWDWTTAHGSKIISPPVACICVNGFLGIKNYAHSEKCYCMKATALWSTHTHSDYSCTRISDHHKGSKMLCTLEDSHFINTSTVF